MAMDFGLQPMPLMLLVEPREMHQNFSIWNPPRLSNRGTNDKLFLFFANRNGGLFGDGRHKDVGETIPMAAVDALQRTGFEQSLTRGANCLERAAP